MRTKFSVGTLVVPTVRASRNEVKYSGINLEPKLVQKVIPNSRGYGSEGAGYKVGLGTFWSYELRRLHRRKP
jgi:hypothetical protein